MLEDAFRIWNHDRPTLLREGVGLAALCLTHRRRALPSRPRLRDRLPAVRRARILPVRLTCRLS